MGTNYYHEREPLNPQTCSGCGAQLHCRDCDGEYRQHIGKSSAGWTFSFHATGTIRSYEQWIKELESGGRIIDEYGDVCSLDDFRAIVEQKRSAPHHHAREYPHDGCFTDGLGHSFSDREFS